MHEDNSLQMGQNIRARSFKVKREFSQKAEEKYIKIKRKKYGKTRGKKGRSKERREEAGQVFDVQKLCDGQNEANNGRPEAKAERRSDDEC